MSVTFVKEGILNTVQDLGRERFRRFGINPSGVMDRAATRIVNILLDNDENEAVLELHFPAGEIRFETDAVIALGGADFAPTIDSEQISNWKAINIGKGGLLRFTSKRRGERIYLAVKGGLKIDEWLGSKSTNLTSVVGGFCGRRLSVGDKIEFNSVGESCPIKKNPAVSPSLIPRYSRFPTVRIIPGAEFESLTKSGREIFRKGAFVLSRNSNRMGFRLHGKPLELVDPLEIISSAVGFGTIQLLPDGQLIVLMADHQTSGGYPRIAYVIERDLPLLAQLGPNDKVAFHEVSICDAEDLLLEFERDLRLLKTGIKLFAC